MPNIQNNMIVGAVVRAKKDITFMDQSTHKKGNLYVINKGEESYYRINREHYELMQLRQQQKSGGYGSLMTYPEPLGEISLSGK